jgi:hypothetical protein
MKTIQAVLKGVAIAVGAVFAFSVGMLLAIIAIH